MKRTQIAATLTIVFILFSTCMAFADPHDVSTDEAMATISGDYANALQGVNPDIYGMDFTANGGSDAIVVWADKNQEFYYFVVVYKYKGGIYHKGLEFPVNYDEPFSFATSPDGRLYVELGTLDIDPEIRNIYEVDNRVIQGITISDGMTDPFFIIWNKGADKQEKFIVDYLN